MNKIFNNSESNLSNFDLYTSIYITKWSVSNKYTQSEFEKNSIQKEKLGY